MSERFYIVQKNKHPGLDGEPWGWLETKSGKTIGYWSGEEGRAAARHHAEQGDMIYHAPDGHRYPDGFEICGLNDCALRHTRTKREQVAIAQEMARGTAEAHR